MAIEFAEWIPMKDEITRGRNIRDGYQRGWGLGCTDLPAQIEADENFKECLTIAHGRTIQSGPNRMNLYLLIRYFLPKIKSGNIVEFGSYRGGSALFMAKAAKTYLPGVKVYALDTFEGMPATDPTIDLHGPGDFKDGPDLDELRAYALASGLDNIVFVKGLFEDTYPKVADEIGQIALSHIDCDIKSAVRYSYEATKPRMVEGGYFVFDDSLSASCIGATEVVEDILVRRDGLLSEQIYPHHVFRAGL